MGCTISVEETERRWNLSAFLIAQSNIKNDSEIVHGAFQRETRTRRKERKKK